MKFRVGVVVLSMLIVAGILVMLFGDARSIVRGSYTIYMHFDDAPGVTDGTPVRKSGILIGRVTKVSFADQGGVNVEAKIDGNVTLYRNEQPQVSGSLLGGDVVIQFVRRARLPAEKPVPPANGNSNALGKSARPVAILTSAADDPLRLAQQPAAKQAPAENAVVQPNEYIEGTVAPNVFQVITNLEEEMSTAINSLGNAGNEVSKLANSFNRIFEGNNDQIDRIINKTEDTLDKFQTAMVNIDDVLGDPQVRGNLKKTIADLPELLAETRSAMSTVRTSVDSMDRNLRNMEGITGPLGERGGQLVDNVDKAVARLDLLLGDLSDFSRKLNRGEGSLGQFMRSPDVYNHINAAAANIEQITRQLKPILADVRVFTDKIARHPSELGIRGAIQNNAGTK